MRGNAHFDRSARILRVLTQLWQFWKNAAERKPVPADASASIEICILISLDGRPAMQPARLSGQILTLAAFSTPVFAQECLSHSLRRAVVPQSHYANCSCIHTRQSHTAPCFARFVLRLTKEDGANPKSAPTRGKIEWSTKLNFLFASRDEIYIE